MVIMGCKVVQIKAEDVQRGSLLVTAGGYVVADTLSGDGVRVYWIDTDNERHYPNPTDGTLTVGVPMFRTQAFGEVEGGYRHALVNAVPGGESQSYCPDARDARDVQVWESGTALASVNCPGCRQAIGLVNVPRGEQTRQSNGI